MNVPLAHIIGFSLIAGVGSVTIASVVLMIPQKWRERISPCLLSYAIGTLLGAAFLGLLEQAVARVGFRETAHVFLAGVVIFFVLEKLMVWRHCHESHCETHATTGLLILVGDALHNFIDGVVIASAFSISIPLGLATAVAIIGHEIPQELGDFAVLLDSGYSKAQAYFYNVLSSSTTLVAGVGSYFFLDFVGWLVPYIMALAAASFVYIAVADLVPMLHRRVGLRSLLLQTALILAGLWTIMSMSNQHP